MFYREHGGILDIAGSTRSRCRGEHRYLGCFSGRPGCASASSRAIRSSFRPSKLSPRCARRLRSSAVCSSFSSRSRAAASTVTVVRSAGRTAQFHQTQPTQQSAVRGHAT
eukprot:scaffold266_cov391-Prasinococcus_capsulatus_cf.AAC.10